jgi:solute carrier family 25 phosphate transporter 23/24/25/41
LLIALITQFFEDAPGAPLTAFQRLSCGAVAGITSVTFTYPLDIVRTRLSIQSASFAGLANVGQNVQDRRRLLCAIPWHSADSSRCGSICKEWASLVSAIAKLTVMIQVGLNFMIYESVRTYFTPEGATDPGSIGKLGAGAISGALAQTCTYPL